MFEWALMWTSILEPLIMLLNINILASRRRLVTLPLCQTAITEPFCWQENCFKRFDQTNADKIWYWAMLRVRTGKPGRKLTGDVFLFIIWWFSAKINLLQSRSNVWQQEWTTLSGASENKMYKYINMNDKIPVNTHHNDSVVLHRYFLRVWPLTLAVPLVLSPQCLIHGDMFDSADIVYTSLFLASQSEMCFRAETCQAPHERDELQTLSWMRAESITNSWHIAANTRRRGSGGRRRWWPTWGNSPRRSLVSSRTSRPVSSKKRILPSILVWFCLKSN